MDTRILKSSKTFITVICSVLLAGLLSVSTVNAADYDLKLGHVTSDKEPVHQAIMHFVEKVKERSKGRINITVFPNAQLGTNSEVYEQLRAGAPIITISDPGFLGDFVPDFGVLGGPYLMKDPRDFSKIIKSDIYKDMSDKLRDNANIELLALNWLFGSRNLIADKPIKGPADIAGMTVRVPPNIMWVKTFEAMGARPTQLPWAEVYSGLSAGVVDAAEAPLPSLYGAKLYEVKKVISMTGHFKGFTGLIINSTYFSKMPKDLQVIMKEEAIAAGVYMTDLMLSSQNEWVAKLEALGVKFNHDVDVDAFQKMTAPVYDNFPKWTPGLYTKIRAILDN